MYTIIENINNTSVINTRSIMNSFSSILFPEFLECSVKCFSILKEYINFIKEEHKKRSKNKHTGLCLVTLKLAIMFSKTVKSTLRFKLAVKKQLDFYNRRLYENDDVITDSVLQKNVLKLQKKLQCEFDDEPYYDYEDMKLTKTKINQEVMEYVYHPNRASNIVI